MEIKRISPERINDALYLVFDTFMKYEAPKYSKEAVETFKKTGIEDKSYVNSLTMYGAFDENHGVFEEEKLMGVIATKDKGSHIALFFVGDEFQNKGIGRQLFNKVIECTSATKITVNASPYAHDIYKHFGFVDTGEERVVGGIHFIPMELVIRD
ncbi:MAG: GNAT family N-acetyltransferase [Bacilli bacterium]|nr:GNAT family N-acetyltransferase [Bacilli bacterium]